MPRLTAGELVGSILGAVEVSGSTAVLLSDPNRNPRQFVIQTAIEPVNLWVYIWTLTHGGGDARPTHEFRIQMTGVTPPLGLNPGGPTLLLGYEPNTGCFAGFDVTMHRTFTAGSPSIQVPITTLNEALQNGLAFFEKGNQEIAIGVRPDSFTDYLLTAAELHEYGRSGLDVSFLTEATQLVELESMDLTSLPAERQEVVTTISRLSRDSSFRKRVTTAYDQRCAVTRMQLRLIDAAHILPVGTVGSNDETHNGISLSPTYHRAFDRGLIYLDDEMFMRLNEAKIQDLRSDNLLSGLEKFGEFLDKPIHLPSEPALRPNLEFVRQANLLRGIA